MFPGRILRLPFLRAIVPRIPVLPVTRSPLTLSSRNQTFSINAPRRLFQLPRRHQLTSPSPTRAFSTSTSSSSEAAPTMSGRLKVLIKSYGWYALGAYLFFSAVDFSFVFACVYFVGAEHVQRMTDSAKSWFSQTVLHRDLPNPEKNMDPTRTSVGGGGLWAMIVLAYGIHKTLLLPVRVGLTAAFTPKMVGYLASRGWRGAQAAKEAARQAREHAKQRARSLSR
jgi:hypothetical protein